MYCIAFRLYDKYFEIGTRSKKVYLFELWQARGWFAGDPVWRADLNLGAVVQPVFMMWLVCVLAALYPAAMSARLDPVKSMHQV